MEKKLHPFYFFLIVVLCSNFLYSQSGTAKISFKIQNNKTTEKEEFYINSISKATMESYRLRNKDVKLVFSNGFECVLFSATSIYEKGIQIDLNDYQEEFKAPFRLPVFSVCDDGQLTAIYQKMFK